MAADLLCVRVQYLCVCVGSSQGPAGGGRAVGVAGVGEGAVAIAMEGRWMAEGRIRKSERLRTLRVALHTERERERGKTQGERVIHLLMLITSGQTNCQTVIPKESGKWERNNRMDRRRKGKMM